MIGYKPRRKGRTRMVDLLVQKSKELARACARLRPSEDEMDRELWETYCERQERSYLFDEEWEDEIRSRYPEVSEWDRRRYEEAQEAELEDRYPRWMTRRDYDEEEHAERAAKDAEERWWRERSKYDPYEEDWFGERYVYPPPELTIEERTYLEDMERDARRLRRKRKRRKR